MHAKKMRLIRSIKEIRKLTATLKQRGKRIGFVPTMGYLHAGHLSLARRSKQECDVTIVSIFVNPLQFGPKEDFKKYPRDLKKDLKTAKEAGVDYILFPTDKQMYPQGYLTEVCVDKITKTLCGATRPGHFKGVTTVVAKLFNIVGPDIGYFGQKDAQQAVVIKRMVRDLNMPLKIKVLPIVRESGGLAMSSRNRYLERQERQDALILYRALQKARDMVKRGERNSRRIIVEMRKLIKKVDSARIDYIRIVDAKDLSEKKKISGRALIALAVFIGKVRLIDNLILKV